MSRARITYPQTTPEPSVLQVLGRSTRDLLALASEKDSLPVQSRKIILRSLKDTLSLVGLPDGFYDLLFTSAGAISGTFLDLFMQNDPRLDTRSSTSFRIDVFLPRGTTGEFIQNFKTLCSTQLPESTPPYIHNVLYPSPSTSCHDDNMPNFNVNHGILSASYITYRSRDSAIKTTTIFIESQSVSPVYPILHSYLSTQKVALFADAYVSFHPTWHEQGSTTSYADARVLHNQSLQRDLANASDAAGFHIIQPDSQDSPGIGNHYCYGSFSCPLTLRSTTDGGVQYVPLTERAALKYVSDIPDVLKSPELVWRHGGICSQSAGSFEDWKCLEVI